MRPPVFDATWPEEVQTLYRHDIQEIWNRQLAPQVWNQYHNQLDYYLAIAGNQPQTILDVGCAQGTLALMLAERGHTVTAADLRPAFLAYAQSRYTHGNIQFLAANVLEDELPGQHDLIYANQIVEHLVYPDRLLARLGQRLRPGGRLVMTTPNAAYFINRLPSFRALGDPEQWEHKQHTADADGHFYAYLRSELMELFTAAGFIQVEGRFFESPWISGHLKVRYLHRYVPSLLLRGLDRAALALPGVGYRLAHQLLVTGLRPVSS